MGKSRVTLPTAPRAWAAHLNKILTATLSGPDRFPVKVRELALEYSANVYPKDPIRRVEGAQLPGFEGALIPIVGAKPGWGIAYNNDIRSAGRIRFTQAHEFGHYLVHRSRYPGGISCSEDDVVRGLGGIEREADQFAADLLMPFDDFRKQIGARELVTIDRLSECAIRYGVSLISATLRWLAYTERRGVLVVSRDGYMLWSRSSDAAWRTGAFFRTSGEPVPIPDQSLAAQFDAALSREGAKLARGIWFGEEVTEISVHSEHYDIVLSLLLLGDAENRWSSGALDENDEVMIAVDKRFAAK